MFFLGTNVSGLRPESSSRPSNSLDYKWNKKHLQQKTKLKNVKSEKPGKTIQTKWSYTI